MSRNASTRFAAVLVALFLSAACGFPAMMEGESMLPSVKNGDRFFVTYDVSNIRRGDLILFKYPHDVNKIMLKRVVGLPGEELEIKSGQTFINGKLLEEAYIDPELAYTEESRPVAYIPSDHYYVAGDNRLNSSDSRIWGTVKKDLIVGKYYTSYYKAAW